MNCQNCGQEVATTLKDQADRIRREFSEGRWRTQLDAANYYGVGQSRISDILNRKTFR